MENWTPNPERTTATQTQLDAGKATDTPAPAAAAATTKKIAWPKTMRDQIATQFHRNPNAGVQSILEALEELGMVTEQDGLYNAGK